MDRKENFLRAIHRDAPRWVPGPEDVEMVLERISYDFFEHTYGNGIDSWGVRWVSAAGREALNSYPAEPPPLKALDDLDGFPLSSPLKAELSPESKALLARPHADKLLVGYSELDLHDRAWLLVGMEAFFSGLILEPEKIRRLIRKICDVKLDLVGRFIEAGIEMMMFFDDWGTERGPYMDPQVWREFIKPELARLYELCRQNKLIICQHSCGKVEEFIPDLVELGVDIWNPCQPDVNDLPALKKKYGERITFWGGIDSRILDLGTPEAVTAEVKKRIFELAPGGGYIAAPSQGLPYRPEILQAMNEVIARYGRHFYDRVS
jgi:uroporphyrinogen decarboxylase